MKNSDFWMYLFILIIFSSFLFFWKITAIPISDGDTFYYIGIAKNILKTGNWLDLKAPGAIVPKPPLAAWLMAASFKIFGANLLGVNFWHLLLGVGVVLLTFLLGNEMFNLRTGFLAGLVLTTAALFFYQVRSPLLDIPLMFFINLSFLFFWLFYKTARPAYLYLFEIATGLSLLVKGLIGPFLILLVVLPFIYFFGGRGDKHLRPQVSVTIIFSSLVIVFVFLIWFFRQYQIYGADFIKMLFRENVVRFFHPIDGPTRATQFDFYSYFLYLVVCFIPWTGFAFAGVWYFLKNLPAAGSAKEGRRPGLPLPAEDSSQAGAVAGENHLEARQFVFCWFTLIFIFFSISGHYKIPRYILPVFPSLALVTGYLFDRALLEAKDFKRYFRASALLTWLIVTPGAIAGHLWLKCQFPAEFIQYRPMFLVFIFIFLGGQMAAAFLVFLKDKTRRSLVVFSAFFLVAYVSYYFLIGSAEKYYNRLVPYLTIAKNLKKEMPADLAVYNLKEGAQDLSFYFNYDLKELKNKKEFSNFIWRKDKYFLFTSDQSLKRYSKSFWRVNNNLSIISNTYIGDRLQNLAPD
jgi:4-amino-4-deoxy-L-arabinose transferase-like glycosyltransferase